MSDKKNIFSRLKPLQPYSGIIYFIIILLFAHFFWKFILISDSSETFITFFGIDVSYPFNVAATHVALVSHKVLNFVGYDTVLLANNVVQHSDSLQSAQVVWGCTGIKQAYIFFCIIFFFRGSWLHKLWYIPLGVLLIYCFNIFRIVLILSVIQKYPEQFDLWHEHILKYLFYGLIFGMWVVWNEKFATKKNL